jgi:hypothetical protein
VNRSVTAWEPRFISCGNPWKLCEFVISQNIEEFLWNFAP